MRRVRFSAGARRVLSIVLGAALVTAMVSAPPASAGAVVTTVEVTVGQWQVDPTVGKVSYDITSVSTCASSTCTITIETGRATATGVAFVKSLSVVKSGSWVDGAWRGQVVAAATGVVLPEVTEVRAVVKDGANTVPSEWVHVSDAYPDAAVAISRLGAWNVDTGTGTVTYDLTATGVGLAQAGELCEGTSCWIRIEAGRAASADATPTVVSSLCESGSAFGAWTLTITCAKTDVTMPEITHVRAWIRSNKAVGLRLDGPWVQVADPFPAADVSVAVNQWNVDTTTGKVNYDLTATGVGLAQGGELCESTYCAINIEAGRAASSDQPPVVVSALCQSDSQYGAWRLTVTCSRTDITLPEITHVRAWIRSNKAVGARLDGPWVRVKDAYPGAKVSLDVHNWHVDTASGKVTYDLTAKGTGLAQAGELCERWSCWINIEAGLADPIDDTPTVVRSLCESTDYFNPWKLENSCTATDLVLPEITHVRAWIRSNKAVGERLDGEWTAVSELFPDAQVATPTIASWVADPTTGVTSYDVFGTATGLAGYQELCENRFCYMGVDAGWSPSDDVEPVAMTGLCQGSSAHNSWTLTQRCTGVNEVLPEITHVRAWVRSNQAVGDILEGPWFRVGDPYPEPTAVMDVRRWDVVDRDANDEVPYSTAVNYDVTAALAGLSRAGGPCEADFCSVRIESGVADQTTGTINPVSALTGSVTVRPREWTATLESHSEPGEPKYIVDQAYNRVAVYVAGSLVLASPWEFHSTVGEDPALASLVLAVGQGMATLLDPCIEAFPVAPHTNPSSLNDAQATCETARAAGASWTRVAYFVGRQLGSSILDRALIELGSDPATIHPDPELFPSAKVFNIETAKRLLSTSQHVYEDGTRARVSITHQIASIVQQACEEHSRVNDDCSGIKLFVPGGLNTMEATVHDQEAIAAGQPDLLRYRTVRIGDWYQGVEPCVNYASSGLHCDEYPFNSTVQGGPGASLKLISARDNKLEGSQLVAFYKICKMAAQPELSDERDYVVLPLPIANMPTTYSCNRS